MKQLLVPFDFSVESDYALEFACKMAYEKDYLVDVLHVLKLPTPQIELSDFDKTVYERECVELNWNRLNGYLSQEKFNEVKLRKNQVVLADGETVEDVIASVVTKNQSDLVIIGNKHVSGMLEEINDSIAAKVMKNSSVPVISLKGFLPINQINTILLTYEFNKEDEVKLEYVKSIADIFNSKIVFLYVEQLANKNKPNVKEVLLNMKQVAERWKLNDSEFYIREAEDLPTGIFSFMNEKKIDMIVIGYHDGRVEKHINEGSIAEGLIHEVPCPVFTIKYTI